MADGSERTANFRRRRRAGGERPVEMWIDDETLNRVDALKVDRRMSSRNAVNVPIVQAYLRAHGYLLPTAEAQCSAPILAEPA